MPIQTISNDTDYKAALTEIERLWDAEPGSQEEAELYRLTLLVVDYEQQTD